MLRLMKIHSALPQLFPDVAPSMFLGKAASAFFDEQSSRFQSVEHNLRAAFRSSSPLNALQTEPLTKYQKTIPNPDDQSPPST